MTAALTVPVVYRPRVFATVAPVPKFRVRLVNTELVDEFCRVIVGAAVTVVLPIVRVFADSVEVASVVELPVIANEDEL